MSGRPLAADTDEIRIEVDVAWNTIAVTVPEAALDAVGRSEDPVIGTLDIGVQGRLMGLEVVNHYVDISPPVAGTEHLVRSVPVALVPHRGPDGLAAVRFDRAGDAYEISFPSGNQCWDLGRTGSGGAIRLCSVLTG